MPEIAVVAFWVSVVTVLILHAMAGLWFKRGKFKTGYLASIAGVLWLILAYLMLILHALKEFFNGCQMSPASGGPL
jgi:hypothetical protein